MDFFIALFNERPSEHYTTDRFQIKKGRTNESTEHMPKFDDCLKANNWSMQPNPARELAWSSSELIVLRRLCALADWMQRMPK